MEKIISISEAFSMQPKFIKVSNENDWDFINDKLNAVKEIILERIEIGKRCGDPVEEIYYVGYNFEGKKIFQYIANTVNVHYESV
jgi:hypothetical protein